MCSLKRPSSPSLRLVLVIPFLLQIAAAVGLTGYFSWRYGQKTVESLVMRLSQENAEHIEKHILNFYQTPTLFLQINEVAARTNRLDLTDYESLSRYFWEQTQLSEAVPYIYFANQQGHFIGVWRESESLTTYRIKDQSTGARREVYKLDARGNPTVRISNEPYDPRQRPWYQAAVKAKQATWSPIYVFAFPPSLGITHTIPILDPSSQQLAGVMAADLTLANISHFLQQLKVSETGQVFIVERSGDIVASSALEQPFLKTEQGETRLAATSSSNVLIQATAQSLLNQFGDLTQIRSSEHFIVAKNGQRNFVQVMPITVQPGLDWVVAIVMPEADFNDYIQENTYTTVLLCLIALAVAIGMGIVTTQWIAKPILQLTKASQKLTQQSLSPDFGQAVLLLDVAELRIHELVLLGKAFNHMAVRLKRAINKLMVTNAELEQRVADRTRELEKTNQELQRFVRVDSLTQLANRRRFDEYLHQTWHLLSREQLFISLILCDVDYFKRYNDTYGHQAGDDCLRKVAEAMLTVVRRTGDLVARYGGEEFAVILPQTPPEGAVCVAEKIRKQVEALQLTHDTSDVGSVVTLSFGVSYCIPTQAIRPETLIETADQALYRAKQMGRNRVQAISFSHDVATGD